MTRVKSKIESTVSGIVKITGVSGGLMALMLLLVTGLNAQDKHSDKNYQPGVPFAISDIESINTTNGNLMFNFGFGGVRGRGTAAQGISLKYNSKLYETHVMTDFDMSGNEAAQKFLRADYEGGWQYDKDYRLRVINRNDDLEQPIQAGGGFEFLPPWQGDGCVNLPPNYKSVYVWKLLMYFPDGSQHEFRPTGYSDQSQDQLFGIFQTKDGFFNVGTNGRIGDLSWGTQGPGGSCSGTPYAVSIIEGQDPNPQMTYYSTDGTFMRLVIPNGQDARYPGTWTLYMPDGSKVTKGEPDGQGGLHNQRVYDKNGNFVTQENFSYPDGTQAVKYMDEAGRYIEKRTMSTTEDWITQFGFGGEPVVWKVKWKYITVIKQYTTSGTIDHQRCCYSNQDLSAQHKVVDEIILPEQMVGDSPGDPLKYKFTYDAHDGQVSYDPNNPNYSSGWGEVKSVTVPSGARAEYDYGILLGFGADEMLKDFGKVAEKRLIYNTNYDGIVTPVTEKWLYDIKHNNSTITGPDGGVTRQFFHSVDIDSDLSGRVFKEIHPNGTIVERIWQHNKVGGCPAYGCGSMRRLNAYVKTEFTTIPDSAGNPYLSAIKDFEYDKNGNTTKITDYDFVSYGSVPGSGQGSLSGIPAGAPKSRITETAFYNPTEVASNTTANNPNSYWNISAKNVNNAVKSATVKSGSGTPVSHTEFFYNNADTTANPTTVRVWDSHKGGTYHAFSNPLSTANSIETTTAYDSYGNVMTATDARGVTSQLTYGAINGFAGLYPTETKTAVGTAQERNASAVYDFNTGRITESTDEDNSVTTKTEYDGLGRPTKVRAAADTSSEIWTTSEYSDVLRRVIVRSDLETLGDGKKVAVQHYDELGRIRLSRSIENIATEDPYDEEDGIKVQTRYKYDNPANPASSNGVYTLTSNPYRTATSAQATNEETMGWSFGYSPKEGKYSTAQTFSGASLPAPWGSNSNSTGIVRTDTDANRTLVTDQAGKKRISKTNALGQLTDVWEVKASDSETESISFPNNSSVTHAYKTSYLYDTLNNLTTVSQGGQARTFTYSSLSRLLSADNPESGLISYVYDDGGNLTSKTDARSITTNYVYDNINRVKTRSYSGEPTGQTTPTVTYTYDNKTNAIGKLTKVTNGTSTTEYQIFDRVGRVTQSQQTTDGTAYDPMTYTYNLSGAMTEQTYPSGRKVKNVIDNDGQIAIVQSKKTANSGYFNYAKNFTFNAAGAVESMQLGNGKWESTTFNSRLQPTQIALGTVQNGTDNLKLNFGYNTTGQNDNNGNVLTQTINVPDTVSATGFEGIQTYNYDELNRLTSAEEKIAGVTSWKQTYTFDRYGNRRFDETNTDTLQSGCPTAVCNPTIDPDTNKLVGYTFDNAGNTKIDANGQTFTYDAENRQILVKDSSNVTVGEYFYDGDGKRIKKIAGSEETIFIYNAGGQLVAEYATQISQTPRVSYLTSDQLGSPRITTDANGDVYTRRDFMPFGEEIDSTHTYQRTAQLNYASDEIRQKFTSYERDNETELDFAQARMFNYGHGRFTSVDPIMMSKQRQADPQSINLYVYVRNNPLKYIDPTGEYIVGTDGKKVKVKFHRDKDGNITGIKKLGKNATSDLKKMSGLISKFNSAESLNQLEKIATNDTRANLKMSSDAKVEVDPTTGGTTYTFGQNMPHDKGGNPLDWEGTATEGKFVGDPVYINDSETGNLVYKEATIVIYEGTFEAYANDGYMNANDIEAEQVVTFSHEVDHNTNQRVITAIRGRQEGWTNNIDVEAPAEESEERTRRQIRP